MASVVQICNIALTRIGQSKLIDSLAERSVAAEMCTLHYEACRDEVLRDFDWPFAEARVALAGIGQPPSNWTFRYRLPDNCLKARSIAVPGTDYPTSEQRIPFKVVYASGGKAVVTNQEAAELIYTVKVEDSSYFDPLFVSALAWRLAAELAMPLTAKPDNYAAAMRNYKLAVSPAQAVSFNEGQGEPEHISEFEQGRA